MPTGYTAPIIENPNLTFEEFVLSCARAFGACISLRDEPASRGIPEKFEASDYHLKEINRITKEIDDLKSLSDEQLNEIAEKEFRASVLSKGDSIKKIKNKKNKYLNMLKQVKDWSAPKDHQKMKEFMIDQIKQSIEFDCDLSYYQDLNIEKLSGEDYKKERMEILNNSLAYHQKEHKKEVEMARTNTLWVQQLRDSLKKQ
jgi:hypothetical protein